METGDHAPKSEDTSLLNTDEIGIHEDDPLEIKPEDFPLPKDDPYETTSYNPKFNDFLDNFKKYENEEYKDGKSSSLEKIRNNTLLNLKSLRKEIYETLYQEYFSNETERNKLIKNRDSYKPFESRNQDIEDFINLSKNISQLEKGIYTEQNKELMFILGEEPSTPNKNLLKKVFDFLKDRKYPFLILALVGGFLGLFVDLEKQLNRAVKKVKEAIAKNLLKKVKSQLTQSLIKAQQAILEATKRYLIIIVLIITILIYYKYK